MKLLLITDYFPSLTSVDIHGGVEKRSYEIARYISRNHNVTVIASGEKGKPRFQNLSGIIVKRVGLLRDYTPFGRYVDLFSRTVFLIFAICSALFEDFDVVEGTGHVGWFPAWVCAKIKSKKSVAFVADIADKSLAPYIHPFSLICLEVAQKFILSRRWDVIICISYAVARKVDPLVSPNVIIKVIYCGTNLHKLLKLSVVKKRLHIVCVARLVKYKRVDVLIKAVKKVKKIYKGIYLSIIGVGEELPYLKKLAAHLDLNNNISFKGFVPEQVDVWKTIKKAQIFCSPSEVEGFGIVTVEALASGVPVVIVDLPINHEITQEKGALFFKARNVDSLAIQLTRLLNNKQLYRKLSNQAKAIGQKYSWVNTNVQTERLYENMYAN